jgi:hypothetical protein
MTDDKQETRISIKKVKVLNKIEALHNFLTYAPPTRSFGRAGDWGLGGSPMKFDQLQTGQGFGRSEVSFTMSRRNTLCQT